MTPLEQFDREDGIGRKSVDQKTYSQVHYFIKKNYGKADKCESKSCPGPNGRFEWALKRGCRYEKKRGNFMMLCSSCHRKYDVTPKFRKLTSKNRNGTPIPKLWRKVYVFDINYKLIGQHENISEAAYALGVSYSSANVGEIRKCLIAGRYYIGPDRTFKPRKQTKTSITRRINAIAKQNG